MAYAIQTAQAVPSIERLIVSTDDRGIAAVARRYGAEVPFLRPKRLATDHSPELLSWKHAVDALEKLWGRKIDILVSIPTTSPLRTAQDIEKCIKKLLQSKADVVITAREAQRNPYFNMLTVDASGYARLVVSPKKAVSRRQQAPNVYDVTTVAYAVRGPYLKRAAALLRGKVKTVIIPQERAWDIDTPLDFEIAQFLMRRRKRTK